MKILIKILPVVLISIVFYLFIYDVYPKYQDILASVKELNELKNKKEELDALENLINSLENNASIKEILLNRERVNSWLPIEPEIENIVFTLYNLYSSLGLNFGGTDFKISEEGKTLISQVLPVKTINFELELEPSNNFLEFVQGIENSIRIMVIKKAIVTPEKANFEVESYYLDIER